MYCISNNCFAGFLYKELGLEYNHPFIWCRVYERDILNMLKSWCKINWKNISIFKDSSRNCPKVNVDGKLEMLFPHYVYSEKDVIPRTTVLSTNGAVNVYCKDNIAYTKEKYLARISRMPEGFPSIVIVHDFFTPECSDDEIICQIAELCNRLQVKLFVISCKRPFMKLKNSEYVRWVDLNTSFPILPKLVSTYKNDILNFVED